MNESVKKTETPQIKVAIVHNWLWKMRGAEHCLEAMCELYPAADIYALFGDVGEGSPISEMIKGHEVKFSWLNKIPFIGKIYRYTLPLWPYVTEKWDLSGYDLVISSSASTVKGVITSQNTKHVSYMYTPMRYLWDQRKMYQDKKGGFTRIIFGIVNHFLRIWDVSSTNRIDHLVSISEFVSKRIEKYYRREPDALIYPPVDLKRLASARIVPYDDRDDSCLVISAYEENKGAKEALEFASKYGVKLTLVGDGVERKRLEKTYRDHENITFLPWLTDEILADYISASKVLLFLGVEDFGIVPLEATYLGTPVIALNKGGAKETIIDGINGVFVEDTSAETVNSAYQKVVKSSWDIEVMREHALKFNKERFLREFSEYISKVLEE